MKIILKSTLIALLLLAGSAFAEPPTISEETKEYNKPWIGAELLYKRYDQNPIAADAKYRYKALTVIGTIEDIGRDILGNPYLVLRGDGEFGGIQCTFGTDAEPEIAKISKGYRVAIYGEITGLVFFNVQVGDCKFTTLPINIRKAIAVK
jgi:hypothetical protein